MTEVLELFQPHEICFECKIISLPRSHHCNLCQMCVERYDHHCPWLNVCIGTRNHGIFFVFILFQSIYILALVTQIIGFYVSFSQPSTDLEVYAAGGNLLNTCRDPEQAHFADWCSMSMTTGYFSMNAVSGADGLVVFIMTFLLFLSLLFSFGLLILLKTQTLNLLTGMTTIERLGAASHRATRRLSIMNSVDEEINNVVTTTEENETSS